MMKAELTYHETADQELYLARDITLGSRNITFEAATIAGSVTKPNEDAFALAAGDGAAFAAVFDGTTSLKPIPALNGQTGARFASHFLRERLAGVDASDSPDKIMLDLNERLLTASSRLGGVLSDTHTLPASLATIVKIAEGGDSFSFAHVGDSFGIAYYEDGHSHVFTDDKNRKFDDEMFALATEIAQTEGITPRQAREDSRVKQALIEMYDGRNNNPNGEGSGLVNGDPQLAKYIQTGSIALEGVTAVLIGSDGLLPPGWSLESEQDRQRMIEAIKKGGFQRLFELKHQAEDDDPDWNFVRFKHSDDATGLTITYT